MTTTGIVGKDSANVGENKIVMQKSVRDFFGLSEYGGVITDNSGEKYIAVKMKLNNLFWYDLLTFIKEEKRRLMKIVRANFSLGYISSKSFDEYYRVALERNDIKIIDDLLTKVTSLDTQK